MVLNDFGELGRALLETDELEANDWTTITNIVRGEYSNPTLCELWLLRLPGLATQGGGCG